MSSAKRELGCPASRSDRREGGRGCQPSLRSSRFSSTQVKWRVLPPRLAMSCRLAGFGEVASSLRFHSHSQRSPGFGLGACWCPGRSGAAIYPTASGGACSATTTSHDFAVTGTGARTAISLGLAVRYLKVKARVSACSPFWLATMTL
jgi:hypothetical protein